MTTNAPTPASWLFAETFNTESEPATQARRRAAELSHVSPVTEGVASLLTVLTAAMGARAVVEIGTGTGVSGLALFAGMAPDGILTSIDPEAEQHSAAREAFKAAGIAPQRFRLITGRALDVLPNLRDGAYDMVLVDGDKLEYVEYLEQATRLLRHGGMLLIDNALWQGKVADRTNDEDETVIIREALTAVRESEEFTSTLVPVGDGMVLAVKA